MLSVCLIFLYLLVSTYIAGFLILSVVGHVFGKPQGEYCPRRYTGNEKQHVGKQANFIKQTEKLRIYSHKSTLLAGI